MGGRGEGKRGERKGKDPPPLSNAYVQVSIHSSRSSRSYLGRDDSASFRLRPRLRPQHRLSLALALTLHQPLKYRYSSWELIQDRAFVTAER